MAWSDAAREASIAARKASAQSNGVAHQNGVGQVGQSSISDRVLDVVRNSPNGNFSVTPNGDVPTKGYMVAVPGRTKEVDANALKSNPKGILAEYAQKNADLLKDKSAHIGGWTDSATGRTHLDVSHNIPNQRAAVSAGKQRNQIAIWDVKRKREIRTGGSGDI